MELLMIAAVVAGFLIWRARGRGQLSARVTQMFRKKPCTWEQVGAATTRLSEYRCLTCKVTAYSGTGQAPIDCKRDLGGSL